MLDIKFIRQYPEEVQRCCDRRGYKISINNILKLDEQYRKLLKELESLRHERNKISNEIRKLTIAGKQKEVSKLIERAKSLPEKIKQLEKKIKNTKEKLDSNLLLIPNILAGDVPDGLDESKNIVVKEHGKIPEFNFKTKPHWELASNLDIIDFEASSRLAGSGFYVLKGNGAKLARALINFMLDFHEKEGLLEISPPLLVKREVMVGTAQLPKFEEDVYKTTEGLYLIPTAEVPLTNLYRNKIIDVKELPKRFCAYTPCFRTEAGKHGTETRGMYRLHQFDKVEMVTICHPQHSWNELEAMRNRAERLLELLELPYQTQLLCAGETCFASAKTYDICCWSPFHKKYLETSSCSNCLDFQARRMNTRFREKGKLYFVHTLNASGLALPRLIISLLECNQQKDGSILVPKILKKYFGKDKIA